MKVCTPLRARLSQWRAGEALPHEKCHQWDRDILQIDVVNAQLRDLLAASGLRVTDLTLEIGLACSVRVCLACVLSKVHMEFMTFSPDSPPSR